MNNWVLANKRLPEEGKRVLVTYLGYNDNKPYCGIAYIENGNWLWNLDDDEVIVEIVAWQYVKPYNVIKLTDDERKLLEVAYNQGYRWVARDYTYAYCVLFKDKPKKDILEVWEDSTSTYQNAFVNMFEFIKWEDEEPYNIEELLKEC